MKFSYTSYRVNPSPTAPNGIMHRPIVPLVILGTSQRFSTWALLDTGSDDTLLPLSVGRLVGAKLDSQQCWSIEGISSQPVSVILGEVQFELTDGSQTFHWPTKVGFVDFADPNDEITILGRFGFLECFRTIFDGDLHEVEIQLTPAFPGVVQ